MIFYNLPRERKVTLAPFPKGCSIEVQIGIRPASWREAMAALFRLELLKMLTEKMFCVPTERIPLQSFY